MHRHTHAGKLCAWTETVFEVDRQFDGVGTFRENISQRLSTDGLRVCTVGIALRGAPLVMKVADHDAFLIVSIAQGDSQAQGRLCFLERQQRNPEAPRPRQVPL